MTNPFDNRVLSLGGPARDIQPVTPSDTVDLPAVAAGLYVETGGDLVMTTAADQTRTITVPDMSIVPVGAKRVFDTGTTATGIHALVI